MKADPKDTTAGAGNASVKKLAVIIGAGVIALSAAGAGAWYFLGQPAEAKPAKSAQAAEPPVYIPLEKFVVNLQPDDTGEHYLQIQFTLQVPTPEQVELIKANMPQVQNRVLMLLSAKQAAELATPEGKQQLSKELVAAVNQPFVPKGDPQEVTDVLYTSFIIQ